MWGKYFSGSCTPEEKEAIHEWIALNPSNEEYARDLEKLWESLGEQKDVSEGRSAEMAWAGVQSRIESRRPKLAAARPPIARPAKNPKRSSFIRAFAVILAIALPIVILDWLQDKPAPEIVSYTSGIGERLTVQLNDGSIVYLSVDSELLVPATFSEDTREVMLTGEAYFDVQSDQTRPFIVQAASSNIQVLGTEFNVRAYEDELDIQLVVTEGQVSMNSVSHSKTEGVYVAAGQKSVLKANGLIEVKPVDAIERLIGWRQGTLEFQEAPIERLIREVERWYNVKIILQDDALEEVNVTALFDLKGDDSFETILQVLNEVLDAEYERSSDEIRFYLP